MCCADATQKDELLNIINIAVESKHVTLRSYSYRKFLLGNFGGKKPGSNAVNTGPGRHRKVEEA